MLLTRLAFFVLENLSTNTFSDSRPSTFKSFISTNFLIAKMYFAIRGFEFDIAGGQFVISTSRARVYSLLSYIASLPEFYDIIRLLVIFRKINQKSVFNLGRWSSQIPIATYSSTVLRLMPSTPIS